MKHILLISLCLISSLSAFAQNSGENKPVDPYDIAQKEYQRIDKRLGIKPEQEFYIDSTLVHNFTMMIQEITELQMGGMEREETYKYVRDKWNDRTLEALKKVFDKEQYFDYMSMIGKSKLIREERKAYLKAKKEKEEREKQEQKGKEK